MSFMAMFPGLVFARLQEDTRVQIEKSSKVRKIIFEKLTVGVNVDGTDCYQRIAEWLMSVEEDKLRKITMEDVVAGVGDYIDESGRLL